MSDSTPRQGLGQMVDGQELDAMQINDALIQFDAMTDICLLGQFVNTPPVSPADGDMYLLGGAPTGAWTGRAYKIAYCIDGGWRFYTPFNGLRAYVAATHAFLVYLNGTWTDANALLGAAEVSIASAATCDLGAAGALFVAITGTTAITGFGSGANLLRFVRFAGALTLTHNAASLILLGGASRVTAAGDSAVYASDAAGNWRERSYQRAAGDPGDAATRSGTETLAHKTLTAPLLTGAAQAANTLSVGGSASNATLTVQDGASPIGGTIHLGSTSSYYGRIQYNYSAGEMSIRQQDTGVGLTFYTGTTSTRRLTIDPTGHMTPGADNTQNLGSASLRLATLYAGTGAINTSGAQTKTGVRALNDAERRVASALAAHLRVYQFRDAVAAKGADAARLHVGMIHEDIVAAFAAEGLDAMRYGLVCRDPAPDGGWILGLRYDELAQFVTAGLAARLDALEAAHEAG